MNTAKDIFTPGPYYIKEYIGPIRCVNCKNEMFYGFLSQYSPKTGKRYCPHYNDTTHQCIPDKKDVYTIREVTKEEYYKTV